MATVVPSSWGLRPRPNGRGYMSDLYLIAPIISIISVNSTSIEVSITGQSGNTTMVPQIRVADTGEYESRTGIAADASTYTYTGLADDTEYELRIQVSDE